MIWVLPKVFSGKPPFSQFTGPVIDSKIADGIRPDRPQGAQKLGLTDSLWEMTVRCWHQDPTQRPKMTEVIGLLSELLMSSLSMEGDLRDFFKVCETEGRDGQGEKAREFADELDEVCYAERQNINPSHHKSRHLTTQVFSRKNGRNI